MNDVEFRRKFKQILELFTQCVDKEYAMATPAPRIQGAKGLYEVGELVAQAAKYRLRLCTEVASGRKCLFKISTSAEHNAALDREAFFLRTLLEKSNALEEKFVPLREYENHRLNYQLSFPELVESFVVPGAENRRVNVLAFAYVDDLRNVTSLDHVITKAGKRADQRSSVWVMGKLLKLLTFAHSVDVTVEHLSTASILLDTTQHYAIAFDWSNALMHADGVPLENAREEIKKVARAVIALLGGEVGSRSFPHDEGGDARYVRRLLELASGSEASAQHAHGEFYDLVDGIWERKFYPFTTFDR